MLIRLRLRERLDRPPTFVDLLSEIRKEKEYEASRNKLNPSMSSSLTKQEGSKQAEIQHLRAEVKELRSMFATMTTKCSVAAEEDARDSLKQEQGQDPESSALKK